MVLSKLVSFLQCAFVPNRDNNMLVSHEILSYIRKKKKGCIAIKFDIEKAYDRLDWDSIRKYFMGWFMTDGLIGLYNV